MKNNLIMFLLATLSFTSMAADSLQSWQKAAIATRFASEVKYNFAQYGKRDINFDSICRAQLPEIINTSTDKEFQERLVLLANSLRDGHTSISWSADVATAPILQKRIGDKVYVTEVFSDDYTRRGVKRGTELVAIDDLPVIEYGEKYVVPFIASSTSQWSATYPYNSINLTKGERGKSVKLTFRNKNGQSFDIVETRELPWGTVNPDMNIKFRKLKGNIGLLTLPTFQQGVFVVDSIAEIFERDILKTDGLIIDIRNNTGGNSNNGDIVMGLLATDSITTGNWQTPQYEAAYASWGQKWKTENVPGKTMKPFWMQGADIPKYEKPIVLLTSGNTFSAAEDFAALFKDGKRGIIMGTPTGGSTGNPIMIDLGWGYWGRICTRNETLADGTEFIGVGIQPDIVVEEDESVIFGNDNVINAALMFLTEHR